MYKAKLPGLPPSMNSMYSIIWSMRRIELKYDCKKYKNDMKLILPSTRKVPKDKPLKLTVYLCGGWYTSKNKIRRIDLQNMEKVLIDAIFEKIGIDDSHVFLKLTEKINAPIEAVIIEIEEYRDRSYGK